MPENAGRAEPHYPMQNPHPHTPRAPEQADFWSGGFGSVGPERRTCAPHAGVRRTPDPTHPSAEGILRGPGAREPGRSTRVARWLTKVCFGPITGNQFGSEPLPQSAQQQSQAQRLPANDAVTPPSALPCADLPTQSTQGLCVQPI